MIEAPAFALAIVRRVIAHLEAEGWDMTDASLIPLDVRMAAVRVVMG